MYSFIRQLFCNKIFYYLASRYLTYFLQFLILLYITDKLTTFYFGVWSFFQLVVSILQYFNYGIGNAVNVYMVQNKNDELKSRAYALNGNILILFICIQPILLLLYDRLFGCAVTENKYQLGRLIYPLALITVFQYWNNYASTVFRVKNKIFEVACFQSALPVATICVMWFATEKDLLYLLVGAWLAASLVSFALFLRRGIVPWKGTFSSSIVYDIVKKGMLLFVYNMSFYFVAYTTKSIISGYYTVEEFSLFSFAFTLAMTAVLFLDGIIFLIFPKMIDLFNDTNKKRIQEKLAFLTNIYITLVHGFGYLTIIGVFILLRFKPDYKDSFSSLVLIVLSLMIYKNAFAYSSYMMSANHEKVLSVFAFTALLLNMGLCLLFANLLHIQMHYCILGMLFSYAFYCISIMLFTFKKIDVHGIWNRIDLIFPMRLFLPFLLAFILLFSSNIFVLILPLVLFLVLNLPELKKMFFYALKLLQNPNIIDIVKN